MVDIWLTIVFFLASFNNSAKLSYELDIFRGMDNGIRTLILSKYAIQPRGYS